VAGRRLKTILYQLARNLSLKKTSLSEARTFSFFPLRLEFRALEKFEFPFQSANVFRGGFGTVLRRIVCSPACSQVKSCPRRTQCPYVQIFEPSVPSGPSGFASPPRPFVFRTRHLDARSVEPETCFSIDIHVFIPHASVISYFVSTFIEIARQGFGPQRSRAALHSVDLLSAEKKPLPSGCGSVWRPVSLPLFPSDVSARRARIDFLSATELKSGDEIAAIPSFHVLFRRIRDRISTLRTVYGGGPLNIDFKGMGKRAAGVRLTRYELQHVNRTRRSSRTWQTHPLGGFTGFAEYEGELAEFLPYLEAARWTGVGRQTVWGNGEIELRPETEFR
jgi:hypothetical protein